MVNPSYSSNESSNSRIHLNPRIFCHLSFGWNLKRCIDGDNHSISWPKTRELPHFGDHHYHLFSSSSNDESCVEDANSSSFDDRNSLLLRHRNSLFGSEQRGFKLYDIP